ncbi:MAG TPA: Rieske (2Fe-2S) protein [Acidimicrobiia bacterium]|jgi:nitrite reductase/ring-hydroxylating ferredoxin subunit
MGVRAGSFEELRKTGRLLTKVGSLPVVVFWDADRAYAIEDRCPHMGFPLHQGTVECGLVTCHWHHARFDLSSGCTLDPFADDARGFDVTIEGDDVFVEARDTGDPVPHLRRRLEQGLEDGLTLVIAKSVLGLLEAGVAPSEIVRVGMDFGTRYRANGWGAGLTVLVAMANLLPHLEEPDRSLALTHGLVFVSRDTQNQAPRFPLDPLDDGVDAERLGEWYRRFVETRSSDAAERSLTTAIASGAGHDVESMMFAAVTDHVFIDGGHTIDFTNKAFEALDHVGADQAAIVLPTLVRETAAASRSEEGGEWRNPHDLGALVRRANERLPQAWRDGASRRGTLDDDTVADLGWALLEDDPEAVVDSVLDAMARGATAEQLGRALAYAAALRLVRFHTQNDHGDWNTVHHAFTAANGLHQALVRNPTEELLRGLLHGALRVYLDRFLNVPAARPPTATTGDLADLDGWWDVQGGVNEAGAIANGYLVDGGDPAALIATLGHALLREDCGFHWYQVTEAAVRQHHAWPAGSEPGRLVLVGLARFLAAHTPTRRETSRVVDIAARLRRGEELYEDNSTSSAA